MINQSADFADFREKQGTLFHCRQISVAPAQALEPDSATYRFNRSQAARRSFSSCICCSKCVNRITTLWCSSRRTITS